MKNNISNFILLFLLFILSFKKVLLAGCNYYSSKDDEEKNAPKNTDTDNGEYLSGLTGDAARQKCYSLSNSKAHSGQCCFDSTTNKCINEDDTDSSNCPVKADNIYNNCGMAYVYEPITSDTCTEISLVQGYCCYIKYTIGTNNKEHTACVRTKELNKNKNSATSQMNDYIQKCKDVNSITNDVLITEVKCHGLFISCFWKFLIFAFIILL